MKIEKHNIDVPDYLNEKFFETVIERVVGQNGLKVKEVSFEMASSPGDNYTSQMYQVKINYETQDHQEGNTSVVIKSMPFTEQAEIVDTFDVYEKEKDMYQKVHTRIRDLLPHDKLAPICYYTTKEPIRTLVLEDLKVQGFKTANREEGLDEYHARFVMKKLGQYHAVTMVICDEKPEIREDFKVGIFTEEMMKTEVCQNVFPGNFKETIKLASSWPGYETIVEKMKRISNTFDQKILDHVYCPDDLVKTLIHGDVWINNFMFQYDQKEPSKPKEFVFVDYQIGFIGSPGIDINNFFSTSLSLDVLKHKREELIAEYYESFSTTLQKLRYKNIPSRDTVRNEIARKEFHGLIGGCCCLPVVCLNRKESHDSSLDTLGDKQKFDKKREAMFRNPRLIETLKFILKRADDLNVLDSE